MKFDADFKAALAAWHERVIASARAQMASATDMAMKVVLRKVQAGDLQAALAVLRGNGLYATGGKPASPVIAAQPGEQPTLPAPQLRPLAELYGSGAIVPLLFAPPEPKTLELPAPSPAVQGDPAGLLSDLAQLEGTSDAPAPSSPVAGAPPA